MKDKITHIKIIIKIIKSKVFTRIKIKNYKQKQTKIKWTMMMEKLLVSLGHNKKIK